MKLRGPLALASVLVVLAVTFGHLLGPFDLLTFLQAGRAVLHGRSPYASPNSPVFRSGHAFVYPLYVAWLFAPLAALPGRVAEAVYWIGSVGAILGSCRLLGRRGHGTTALVLVSSTTIIGLQMGTLNALLLLGLAGAWHWRDSKPMLAGLVLGAAATAKLFLLPVLLWPVLRRRVGMAASAVATVLALMVSSAALGSLSPLGYVEMMSKLDARERVVSWSLSSFLQGLGAGRTASSGGALLVAVAGLAVLYRRRFTLGEGQLLGGAVVCSLLVSPILWSSYLLLLAVPLLLNCRDRVLAVFALVSWAVVTPDAASPARVAVGVAVAALVSATAARPAWATRLPATGRRLLRRLLPLLPLPAALALLVVVLPAPARGPLPALLLTGAAAGWCLRPARRGEKAGPAVG
ncbi:MAG TPA: glycosyltransferase family 87 protein [Acidimicrobiales bacterium]|nr:glycosyltransferase family 87 protein [Acidimicrobiales bacterium]